MLIFTETEIYTPIYVSTIESLSTGINLNLKGKDFYSLFLF
jgi:hypothetical protein